MALIGVALVFAQSAVAEAPQNFALNETPKPLPEIQFEDGEAHAQTLAGFKDKVVLLNVWATWCTACRKEMPTLDRLQAELGGPEFEVIALSVDRAAPELVRQFYTEIGIQHLSLYIDVSGKAVGALGIVGLPTTLLIDRQGHELGHLVGPADWDTPEMIAFLKGIIKQQFGNSTLPQHEEKRS
jgi:thiol-disulfide isomerase/thioredoxin